jgi:hypothetical protein
VGSQLFDLDGTRLEVRTTSPRFSRWIDEILADRRVPDDGADEPTLSIVVDDEPPRGGRRGFHLLYRRISAVVRTLHLGTLARSFIAEVERFGLPQRADAVHLDGAIVDVRGTPVLVPGSLVPLMATLGRRAEREGIRLPGHSAVAVDASGRVVPAAPTVDPADSLRRLERLFGPDGSSDRVMVESAVEPEVIVLLAAEPGVVLRPTSGGSALHRLATRTLNLPLIGGPALQALHPLVERARCYETTWAGSARIPDVLLGAVENRPSLPYVDHRTEDTRQGR